MMPFFAILSIPVGFTLGIFTLMWMSSAWGRLADSYRADLRLEDDEHKKLVAKSEEMTRRKKSDLTHSQQELARIDAMPS